MTLTQRVQDHHYRQFGSVSVHQILSKLTEEVGETASNVTRWTEGRPTIDGKQWDDLAICEIGDVLIVLTALCAYLGADIETVLADAVDDFCLREWPEIRSKVTQ